MLRKTTPTKTKYRDLFPSDQSRLSSRHRSLIATAQRGGGAHFVHLRQEKVFAQLGEREERDAGACICDIGATNHMSGSWVAFSKVDTAIRDTVWFRDDSVAKIERRDTVVFKCRNGEERSFAGVYYIPQLMANIINVCQLDESGYDIHIKQGVMSVRESGEQLLTSIECLSKNRLYVLNINLALVECLAAHGEEARR
jgi:hypothetical protein